MGILLGQPEEFSVVGSRSPTPLLTTIGARMSAVPTVRPVKRADFDQWLPLWEGYNKFYGRSGATALPAEITRTTWARFFDAAEPVHALVAESDGRLVGLTHYLFHRSTIMLGPTCYLRSEARRVGQEGRSRWSPY